MKESFNQLLSYVNMDGFIYNSALQCIVYSYKYKIFFALGYLFLPNFLNICLNEIWLF